MSSGGPPRPPPVDKGKGIAKTRKRHNNYVLQIPLKPITPTPGLYMPSLSFPPPPTGLHNLTSIPTIHMSSSSSQPPPTRLHTSVVALRPPSIPPSHIPSSSSSAPHTGLHTPSIDIRASPSPHTIPSPASIGGPSSAVGQQSAPSPVAGDIVAPQPMEEFQTRLSQVRSEVSSCADGTQEQSSVDPTQDDSIRTSLEENEQLKSEFRSFQSLVLQYLPPDAQARLQKPQPQPQPQQPNPTQQNSEIPPLHSQQQNNEEDNNVMKNLLLIMKIISFSCS
ncbi:hypothetical protein DEO72_LG6g1434 [Vigna unguiculata]|uniref:Uncharacterized protein n=1 Tax=Vigna unguiculata TaxID=3917 RepID=A0A4D6M662_VIGUN|nr:hypothetical protein DEO72_LG6g1434 [Vigna unguiculata]